LLIITNVKTSRGWLISWVIRSALLLKPPPPQKRARLHCVKLFETPRNFAEYHGPLAD